MLRQLQPQNTAVRREPIIPHAIAVAAVAVFGASCLSIAMAAISSTAGLLTMLGALVAYVAAIVTARQANRRADMAYDTAKAPLATPTRTPSTYRAADAWR